MEGYFGIGMANFKKILEVVGSEKPCQSVTGWPQLKPLPGWPMGIDWYVRSTDV